MSDTQITGQQAGQSENLGTNPSENGQIAQQEMSPKFVTVEEFASLKAEILNEATARAQSLVDKKGNAINAKIAELQKAGITATPEQARALIEADEQAQSGTQGIQTANSESPAAPYIDPQVSEWFKQHTGNEAHANDPYYMAVYEISKQAGDMFIEPNDPEYEMVNREFQSGSDFVSSFAQAITQKKLREANENNNQFAAVPGMFSGGQKTNAVPDNIDYQALYSQVWGGK